MDYQFFRNNSNKGIPKSFNLFTNKDFIMPVNKVSVVAESNILSATP
ncbi:hypothetical protein [Candidatus Parabeggiatoa sp. HSG14]|nr:hypothetical protein [Thiotrichales bacterium HSG14]